MNRIAIHVAAQNARHAGEKVPHIVECVQANEISAQKALEDLIAPRQNPKHLRGGEGDVVKVGNPQLGRRVP